MDCQHKELLIERRADLVENINIRDGLYTELTTGTRKVLNKRMIETLQFNKTAHQQVEALLDILPTRGPRAFQHFCDALKADFQEEVVTQYLTAIPEPSEPSHTPSRKRSIPEHAEPMQCIHQCLLSEENRVPSLPEKCPRLGNPGPLREITNTIDTDGAVPMPVETCTQKFYEEHRKEAYKMDSHPRGLALIINVNRVKGKKPRPGTNIDCQSMKTLLEGLSFNIDNVYNDEDDLSSKGIMRHVKKFSEMSELRESDCAVVCFLSHGEEGHIFGTDGEKVPLSELYRFFVNDKCKMLRGKPKIFIHQACRGEKEDFGVTWDESDGKLPTVSDMILCFPTQLGYVSWRNPAQGSWYIQAIAQVFTQHAKNEDICTMLNRVNGQISRRVTNSSPLRCEMSEYTSTLTKPHLFFFPGIRNPEPLSSTPGNRPSILLQFAGGNKENSESCQ